MHARFFIRKNLGSRFLSRARRKVFSYQQNKSCALASYVPNEKLRQALSSSDLLELSKDNIIEHCARRADLLFYLFIGCYKKNFKLQIQKTNMQHGKGKPYMPACHSSLFSNIFGKKIENNKFVQIFNDDFIANLNSTVALPLIVNYFDLDIEIRLGGIAKMFDTLQEISCGDKTPLNGMEAFFTMMEDFLCILAGEAENLNSKEMSDARKYLIRLVSAGTFTHHWNAETKLLKPEYVRMILREFSDGDLSENNILDRISIIQQELLKRTSNKAKLRP